MNGLGTSEGDVELPGVNGEGLEASFLLAGLGMLRTASIAGTDGIAKQSTMDL